MGKIKNLLMAFLVLLTCCTNESGIKPKKKIIIGFSQCTMIDDWRKTMVEEMKREIAFFNDYDIKLIVKDANDNSDTQIKDIRELIAQGINILIVSPNEAAELTPVVEEVYKKGIPVIVIDRKINSQMYSAFIGADNLLVGKEAGYFASELLKGKGKILEITGLKGSTPAIERSRGFHEIIDKYPEIITTKVIEGAWLEEKTLEITDSLFRTFTDFDLIFAHNDFMANAASISARKHKIKTFIIGVDGMNTPNGGVNMVIKGFIDGTIYYPTGGDKAIQLAIDILSGKPYEKNISLSSFRIDNTNARTIWLQGQQIREQQAKIDKQNEQLKNISNLLYRRNIILLMSYSIIIMMIIIMIITFVSWKNKSRMNKILDEKNKTIREQNQIITKQRDDSINFLMVAEEAKENKLRLFTDLSHELRTVVTLITNPINDILNATYDESLRTKIKVLQRSTDRLARLTDSILKFRSIDENKYQLTFYSANISHFIKNIAETFEEQAKNKNITLRTEIPEEIYAEFDLGVIEKVMYNLLSNAIKYTNKSGIVIVSLKAENSKINIKVQDTGVGIPKRELPLLFNRFYRINNSSYTSDNEKIGVGLALCKELINLHGGQITVESIENQGTTFFISIPQFHSFTDAINNKKIKKTDILNIENATAVDYEKTVLIVEDNPDVQSVIVNIIGKYYNVLTARDGREGLNLSIKKIPDLILSDILMPVMDGMQLCIEVKKHAATCHIPVVLLTAIDSPENTIKSFDIGADAYVTKPFNEFVLLSNIRNLIENREKLREFYCPSPFFRNLIYTKDQAEGDFIKECLNIIYENIENDNFTLTSLSKKMNMSRSSFYRRIIETTAIKPVDFIKKAKLNYAAKLILSNGNKTINEISWRSGFSDPKYFSKCFIQEFGINPSSFSKDYLNKRTEEKNV
ncbi:MAG TPA: substrate-binding domain-containing protein [Bacteroidales bacterium]|nr:substrate-binding domain-containing protein [Bacteroidales bacterium]